MATTDQTAYLFLSGIDMEPAAVLTAHPGARFVARARVGAAAAEIAETFAGYLAGEVWGILVATQATGPVGNGVREAVTDDGRRFFATPSNGALVSGAPGAALAAARYWELPPEYVRRLRDAVAGLGAATGDEAPSDGN